MHCAEKLSELSTRGWAVHVQEAVRLFWLVRDAVCGDYLTAPSDRASVKDTFLSVEVLVVA